MTAPVPLRPDFEAEGLRALTEGARDPAQTRRLLALSAIEAGGSRREAAKLGGVRLQTVRDRGVAFNAHGPDGLVGGKAPGTCRYGLRSDEAETVSGALKQTFTAIVWRQSMIRTIAGDAMHPSIEPTARCAPRWSRIVPHVLSVALLGATPSRATTLHLPNISYNYSVVEQELVKVIQEFGRNTNLKINISPEVSGIIEGQKFTGNAREFFERTMRDHNLDWYYDGGVIYVTAAKENRTQLLVLSPISFSRFKNVLESLDISDSRYPIRPAPGMGVVMTYGPPRYVALIEQTLAGLVAEEMSRRKPRKDALLMVFRGSQMTVFRHGVTEGLEPSDPPPAAPPHPAPSVSPSDSAPARMQSGRGGSN